MSSGELVVSMAVWSPRPPTHCISSMIVLAQRSMVVTGSYDGQLVTWKLCEDLKMTPLVMLFGHTTAVNCLAEASDKSDENYIVSGSENGELCLWDLEDGRCLESTRAADVHEHMSSHRLTGHAGLRVVCCGMYPEIMILDPITLTPVVTLHSQNMPDWISVFTILKPVRKNEDIVLAITASGSVKVWTLTGTEASLQPGQFKYEDESKQIRCLNALTLTCCSQSQRTVLIVCAKYWQIYDAVDFTALCSEACRREERWVGGYFLSRDQLLVWSSAGRAYLYSLPQSVVPGSAEFRKNTEGMATPIAIKVLDMDSPQPLSCTTVFSHVTMKRDNGSSSKLSATGSASKHRSSSYLHALLRGDSEGRLVLWMLDDQSDSKSKLTKQDTFDNLPVSQPQRISLLSDCWKSSAPRQPRGGILSHLSGEGDGQLVTASVYMPSQGLVACGKQSGLIIVTSATVALRGNLLNDVIPDTVDHRELRGHTSRVSCLLYPHNDDSRYSRSHLLSGSADFSVILWDLNSGCRLHQFCTHAGEVSQLLVPPPNCSPRVLNCVCSVASDHSVALLNLRDLKLALLASRHIAPVSTVKWRPLDDYLMIGCADGSVYAWQMDTGQLDRVEQGTTAEEMLSASEPSTASSLGARCMEPTSGPLTPSSAQASGNKSSNVSLAQALRRRNLAAFKAMAQQRLAALNKEKSVEEMEGPSLSAAASGYPMLLQGLRANPLDAESHVVLIDVEGLIVELLSEEYARLLAVPSSSTSSSVASSRSVPAKPVARTKRTGAAPSPTRGLLAKVKEKAEDVGQKIQAKAETAGIQINLPTSSSPLASRKPARSSTAPQPLTSLNEHLSIETAQLLVSCLHGWGLDKDVDKLAIKRLGLIHPPVGICFGNISRGGQMALMLPTEYKDDGDRMKSHWHNSRWLTTQHLLAVIATANTMMSLSQNSLKQKQRSMSINSGDISSSGSVGSMSDLTKAAAEMTVGVSDVDMFGEEADPPSDTHGSAVKQGWSLLAALHCVLLPELVGADYKAPLLPALAKRWQHKCLEIREAAQAMLLAELRRLGPDGRHSLVNQWVPLLPAPGPGSAQHAVNTGATEALLQAIADETDSGADADEDSSDVSEQSAALAVIVLGVVAAQFGSELELSRSCSLRTKSGSAAGISAVIRQISHALASLLLHAPGMGQAGRNSRSYTPIRRAAIDLVGRGFPVWEPHLDTSAVLLGLLELCVDAETLLPRSYNQYTGLSYGLPLSAAADTCRSARHALCLIASARPATFLCAMAKEVARFHAASQQAGQSQAAVLSGSVLSQGKAEILRVLEHIIENMPHEAADHLVEVMDITMHCLDQGVLKAKGLQETFPSLARLPIVSYCVSSRRVCVATTSGQLAFYDASRSQRAHLVSGHHGPVAALCFSPDGRHLASYAPTSAKLFIWQTGSHSLFGLSSQVAKCIKKHNAPMPANERTSRGAHLKIARIVWVDTKTAVLLMADGREQRYKV